MKSMMTASLNTLRRNLKLRINRLLGRTYVPARRIVTIHPTNRCNLACRFCAYPKLENEKLTTQTQVFRSRVENAVAAGFDEVNLTPITGEVFMDKDVIAKMQVLEELEGIKSYHFFTNFILCGQNEIIAISDFRKIDYIAISIYGHDLDSFSRITKKSENQYEKLVKNLETLSRYIDKSSFTVSLLFRSEKHFQPDLSTVTSSDSGLLQAVARLARHPRVTFHGNRVNYDNWGGLITQDDLSGLNMDLQDPEDRAVYGPCRHLFEPTILPDGKVNACNCRDFDRSLIIGDTNRQSMAEIVSPSNAAYRTLFQRHLDGDFPKACADCTVYDSIFRFQRGLPTKRADKRWFVRDGAESE